jgi:hypothetical protein
MTIDAEILKGYDLPPRLERMLLDYFRGHKRPAGHPFEHWLPADLTAYIPLHEYLDPGTKAICRDWVTEVFQPLPLHEAEALEGFLD